MFEITEGSTHKEILLSLWARPRYEIAAICILLNKMGHEIQNYLTKERMMDALSEIDKEDLLEAIDFFDGHGEEDDDDEESDEDEDDDEESED
ncbi:MAG: hypothetical protein H6623_08935 [Bdellovibrionaceae bacterium]|nr:hypothetical protein [Pseudobdellovibrionaceae bacterium]